MKDYNPLNGIVGHVNQGMAGIGQMAHAAPVPSRMPSMYEAQHEALSIASGLVDRLGRIAMRLHANGEQKDLDQPCEPTPPFSGMPRAIQEKLKICHQLTEQLEQTLFGM